MCLVPGPDAAPHPGLVGQLASLGDVRATQFHPTKFGLVEGLTNTSGNHLPFVLTAPNTPLVRSVMPMTAGMKKSMYRVLWVTIGTCCTLRLTVELERLAA